MFFETLIFYISTILATLFPLHTNTVYQIDPLYEIIITKQKDVRMTHFERNDVNYQKTYPFGWGLHR